MPQPLGQHFLKNPAVTEKTLAALKPSAGEYIVEIGPGKGALTRPLLALCREENASYVGIEKDPVLAQEISPEIVSGGMTLIEGDALRELPQLVERFAKEGRSYRLIGNIPYYITGFLLRVISECAYKPKSSLFLIQKEVADRICAGRGAANLLSASVQVWAEPRILCTVPASDFDPPPQVTSAVIELVTLQQSRARDLEAYYAMMRSCFKQPRKTLLNNLVESGSEKAVIMKVLQDYSWPATMRPQDLSPEDIARLADGLPRR